MELRTAGLSELTMLEFICAAYEQLRSDIASVKLTMNTTSGHVNGAKNNRVGPKWQLYNLTMNFTSGQVGSSVIHRGPYLFLAFLLQKI